MYDNAYFTIYAPGFTEEGFEKIRVGDTTEFVLETLGRPLAITPADFPKLFYYSDEDISIIREQDQTIVSIRDPNGYLELHGLDPMRIRELEEKLGEPNEVKLAFDRSNWEYTKFKYNWTHKQRLVVIDNKLGTVAKIVSTVYSFD
ncbi:MAG: hypothetical protein AMXMBFR84_49360 [Candidatus Hydrogenedentota bacterium]